MSYNTFMRTYDYQLSLIAIGIKNLWVGKSLVLKGLGYPAYKKIYLQYNKDKANIYIINRIIYILRIWWYALQLLS